MSADGTGPAYANCCSFCGIHRTFSRDSLDSFEFGIGLRQGKESGKMSQLSIIAIGCVICLCAAEIGNGHRTLANPSPIVCISDGCIEGQRTPGHQIDHFESFFNIPYAQPPVGQLRFAVNLSPNQRALRWGDGAESPPSWITDPPSWITDPSSWITDPPSWIMDHGPFPIDALRFYCHRIRCRINRGPICWTESVSVR